MRATPTATLPRRSTMSTAMRVWPSPSRAGGSTSATSRLRDRPPSCFLTRWQSASPARSAGSSRETARGAAAAAAPMLASYKMHPAAAPSFRSFMTRRGSTPLTPQQAQAAIDARLVAVPPEVRPLDQCIGQTLREDIYAERDNPPFDRVCMDGIAVDSGTIGRGVRRLALEAMQPAGAPALTLASREQAIEVMTGAILPRGTDSVIPLEEYDVANGFVTLKANASGPRYRNVQRR